MDSMNEKWVYYEELIEIIALITQEVFESVVLEEIAAVWEVFLEWH